MEENVFSSFFVVCDKIGLCKEIECHGGQKDMHGRVVLFVTADVGVELTDIGIRQICLDLANEQRVKGLDAVGTFVIL